MPQAVAAAQAAVDKANGDLAAAQKSLAEAPARMKAREDVVAKAREAVASANTAIGAAESVVQQKEDLAKQANDVFQKIAAEAAKAADNKNLAEASAKAKAAVDALGADVRAAKQVVATRTEAAKAATDAMAGGGSGTRQREIGYRKDAGPDRIPEAGDRESGGRSRAKKAAADEAAKAVAAAKAKADALNAEYQKRSQEAGLNPTTQPARAGDASLSDIR